MNPERIGPGFQHLIRKSIKRRFRILIVHADTAFDRDRDGNRLLHGGNTARHHIGRQHQARPESPGLDTIRRAADIEIDLVIAEIRTNLRGLPELGRIGAAKLQSDRIFRRIEAKQTVARTEYGRIGDNHFGIEQSAF